MRAWIILALAAVAVATSSRQCHNLGSIGGCEGPPMATYPSYLVGGGGQECSTPITPVTGIGSTAACQNLCQTTALCSLYVYQLFASYDGSVAAGTCLMFQGTTTCCPPVAVQTAMTAVTALAGPPNNDNPVQQRAALASMLGVAIAQVLEPFNTTTGSGSVGVCTTFPDTDPGSSAAFSCPAIASNIGVIGQQVPATGFGTTTIQHTPPTGCNIVAQTSTSAVTSQPLSGGTPSVLRAQACQQACEATSTLTPPTCGGWIYQAYQKYDVNGVVLPTSPGATPQYPYFALDVCYFLPPTFPVTNSACGTLTGATATGTNNDLGAGGFCFAQCTGSGAIGFNEQCNGNNLGSSTTCYAYNSTLYAQGVGTLACGLNCDYDTSGCFINAAASGLTLIVECSGTTCSISVVLPVQPTANVVITFTLLGALGIISVDGTPGNVMTFTIANWNVPQFVIVVLTGTASAKLLAQGIFTLVGTYSSLDPNYEGAQTQWTLVTSSTPATGTGAEPYFGYPNDIYPQQIQSRVLVDAQGTVLQTDTTNSFNGSGAAGIVYAALGSTFGLLCVIGCVMALVGKKAA